MISALPSRTLSSVAHILGLEDVVRVQDPDVFVTAGKHPRWFIRPFIDSFDSSGNPIRIQKRIYLGSVATMRKREALTKKAEILSKVNRSQVVLQAQLRFGALVDYYLKEFVRAPGKLSASTQQKYENHIENHVLPAWKDTMLCDIRGLEIDRWLTAKGSPRVIERAGKQEIKPGLSWNTRTDLRNILSGIFTKAKDWGLWTGSNPVERVSVGRKKLVREKFRLTEDQTIELLTSLPEDVRLICMVALFCTCRISEILGIRWKHVNLETGVMQIRERYWRGNVDEVKTDAAVRDVYLERLAVAVKARYPGAGHEDEFVFNVETKPEWGKLRKVSRDASDINQHFLRPAAKALGIYRLGFGFHSFRREAITNIARDAGAVQAMLAAGHRRLDMTMLYALQDRSEQQSAVQKSQERFGKVIELRKGVA